MAQRIKPSNPRSGPRQERVAAFKFGLSAESRAAMFLIAKGYRNRRAALEDAVRRD
jgi:hypothetical protein